MAKKTKKTTASKAGDSAAEAETQAPVEDQISEKDTPLKEASESDVLDGEKTGPVEPENDGVMAPQSDENMSDSVKDTGSDEGVTADAAAADTPTDPTPESTHSDVPGTETQDAESAVKAEEPGDLAQTGPSEESDEKASETEGADASDESVDSVSDAEKPDDADVTSEADPHVSPEVETRDAKDAESVSDTDDIAPKALDDTPEPEKAELDKKEPQQQVVVQKAGFMPMLLGGVAAAALGFVAADYSQPGGFLDAGPVPENAFESEARAALDATAARLDALEAEAPGLDAAALAPLEEAVASVQNEVEAVTAEIAALSETQSDLDARLLELAQAPLTDNVSDAAIAAYEAELAALQESMATQRAEIEGLAAAAAERETQAQAMIQAAEIESAAAALIVQVETGAPFDAALQAYLAAGGAPVDAALSDLASDGVPTLEGLQSAFPDVARAALAATRDPAADASDGAGGLGTFFARQLGARSVTPREGDDPDAVLSRAEAAVRNGDLTTALTELETLPEAGRAALADWEATATARRDALAAATALAAPAQSN